MAFARASHSVFYVSLGALTLVRRSCRLPLYQVMMAFGREPILSHAISYRRSATSWDGGPMMFTVRGFTVFGDEKSFGLENEMNLFEFNFLSLILSKMNKTKNNHATGGSIMKWAKRGPRKINCIHSRNALTLNLMQMKRFCLRRPNGMWSTMCIYVVGGEWLTAVSSKQSCQTCEIFCIVDVVPNRINGLTETR